MDIIRYPLLQNSTTFKLCNLKFEYVSVQKLIHFLYIFIQFYICFNVEFGNE